MLPRIRAASNGSKSAAALGRRHLAAPASSQSTFAVFDRDLKLRQREAAARNASRSRLTDYVKDDVAANMVDRLLDIKRRFPQVLDIGAGPGFLAKHLDTDITQKLIMTDSSSCARPPSSLLIVRLTEHTQEQCCTETQTRS